MDTTAKSMVEFFEKARKDGRMKSSTARSIYAPVKQIFKIDENWEQIDVSELDIEDFLARFRNLQGSNYKPDSLVEYERRFKRARDLYLEYVRNPKAWKFEGQPAVSNRKEKPKKAVISAKTAPSAGEMRESTTIGIAPSGVQMMDYPFPLREGCVIRLRLPADLKPPEVDRLTAFMRTIAVDYTNTQ